MTLLQERLTVGGVAVAVKRTNRKKTAAIKVEKGQVEIVVPKRLGSDQVREFLLSKERWIMNKLKLQSHANQNVERKFQSGEPCLLLGKTLTLDVSLGGYEFVELSEDKLLLYVKPSNNHASYKKQLLSTWYRQNATRLLNDKVITFCASIGVNPQSVIVKQYKSRWGSCHANGRISFNWKIIMAPEEVVDYVVVHELCHLIHFNHSSAFWQEVERHLPDYRQSKRWLKMKGLCLEV